MGELLPVLNEILVELKKSRTEHVLPKEWLSVPEASDYLGVAVATLRDWIRLRRVPFHKINGTIKFKISKLDRWLETHEIPTIKP
jgi:excisionase family DNA binding protein